MISDSSFKGDQDDALAMRSGLIVLGNKDGPTIGDNQIQIIDFVSKKQSRICRSTYTAELYSALDLMALGNVINLALTEILTGTKTASELANIQEHGKHAIKADLVLDAKSVYDSVCSSEVKSTSDKLMLIHALKLKELLTLGIANRLLWIDTRDMISDALNKGVISREEIRRACSHGVWRICQTFRAFSHDDVTNSERDLEPS